MNFDFSLLRSWELGNACSSLHRRSPVCDRSFSLCILKKQNKTKWKALHWAKSWTIPYSILLHLSMQSYVGSVIYMWTWTNMWIFALRKWEKWLPSRRFESIFKCLRVKGNYQASLLSQDFLSLRMEGGCLHAY